MKSLILALLAALAILVVNVAISFGVVAIYAYGVDPGHDEAYYQAAAQWLAPISSIAFGWLLFMLVTYLSASRGWTANALYFAILVFAFYAALDLGILMAVGDLVRVLDVVAVSLASKLAGALLGVYWVEQSSK